jgi:hypothetical protein
MKCASKYGRIGGLREHDIVVGGIFVREGGYKTFVGKVIYTL